MPTAPNSENYTLGRGRLAFNRKVNGSFTGLRDLGNATDFTINVTTEKKDHYSSRQGLKVKDASVVVSMTVTGSFTLDEIMDENLALTLMASITEVEQTAATGKTHQATGVKIGHYIQLPDYFIDGSTVVVEVGATAKTVGTDYTVDANAGQLFIPATSTILPTDTVDITYSTAAKTFKKLNAFDESSVEGELHFISNVGVGTNMQARIWKAILSPSGDLGLISDDWSSLKFDLELGDDSANHPLFPYMEMIIE